MKKIIFMVVMFSCFASFAKASETMRCKGRIVSVGDTSGYLRECCGEPIKIVKVMKYSRNNVASVDHELWTIEIDRHSFTRIVKIRSFKIISIEEGSKP